MLTRTARERRIAPLQGMNFIAGALLLFMDEEVVFWALATIVEDILPGYFAQDLVAAQVDQLVFKHMVLRLAAQRSKLRWQAHVGVAVGVSPLSTGSLAHLQAPWIVLLPLPNIDHFIRCLPRGSPH